MRCLVHVWPRNHWPSRLGNPAKTTGTWSEIQYIINRFSFYRSPISEKISYLLVIYGRLLVLNSSTITPLFTTSFSRGFNANFERFGGVAWSGKSVISGPKIAYKYIEAHAASPPCMYSTSTIDSRSHDFTHLPPFRPSSAYVALHSGIIPIYGCKAVSGINMFFRRGLLSAMNSEIVPWGSNIHGIGHPIRRYDHMTF